MSSSTEEIKIRTILIDQFDVLYRIESARTYMYYGVVYDVLRQDILVTFNYTPKMIRNLFKVVYFYTPSSHQIWDMPL